MDKPVYIPGGENYPIIVKGKRPSHLMTGILPSSVDATQGIPTKAGINNLDDLFAAGALQGEQTTKEMEDFGTGLVEFAKEHPASLASGLVGGALLPATIPGMLAMGGIGAGSELADAKIRGEDVSAKDLALAAGIQGLTHGILGRAPVEGINGGQALREAVAETPISGRNVIAERPNAIGDKVYIDLNGKIKPLQPEIPNPVIYGKPTIPATEVGGLRGYHVLDYDMIPGAREIEAKMLEEGTPRFIPASSLNEPAYRKLGDAMVGNPSYMQDPFTPEGEQFVQHLMERDPRLDKYQGNAFSGSNSSREFDPEHVVNPTDMPSKLGGEFINGKYYNTKWHSMGNRATALGYAKDLTPEEGKKLIFDKIASGEISESNLPGGFSDLDDLMRRALAEKNVLHGKDPDLRRMVRMFPENEPMIQELIPFYKNVKFYDKMGKGWASPDIEDPELHSLLDEPQGAWMYQKGQINKAKAAGHDAIIYDRSADIGGALRTGKSLKPYSVLAGFWPNLEKYPFNYGTWNLNDVRPLAAVPLAAGLGAGIVNQSRQ